MTYNRQGGLVLLLIIYISVALYACAAPQRISIIPTSTCTTPYHDTGDSTGTLSSGGLKRSFLVHLAPSYGQQPQPLVILYHGYSWTSQIMENTTHMNNEADSAGFVLVYPQGVDTPPSWNAGVGAYGPTGDANDIQFTRDLLKFFAKNYCVDSHHVYIAGFSLGGGMAYRIACTLSDQIAAIATVSGAYYPIPGGCQPTRPVPVLEIHGAADMLAPYNGNPARRLAAVHDYLHAWLTYDQCSDTPTTFFQQGDVTGIEWTHCATGIIVRHYRISDGQHTWPGSPGTTHVIDANEVIWQFFSQFTT